jgi:anthraniloyl-CoA monooxygenase
MEDAIELEKQFRLNANVPEALVEFESARRPVIEDYQAAAYESMLWFENARQHINLSAMELAFSLMTRSGRVGYEDLRKRDPEFIRRLDVLREL